MKKKAADFVYRGVIEFNPQLPPERALAYEKLKYKQGILPRIQDLAKEVAEDKKESKEEEKEFFDALLQSKLNHRSITFRYENNEVYPKDVTFPDIRLIPYPEPHVLITDLYDNKREWYTMRKLIEGFAEEAYLSYEIGLWLSSISAAVNCCEYILKYEYIRKLNKVDAEKAGQQSEDRYFSLGSFVKGSKYLLDLGLQNFKDKIAYLNDVRVSLYHFSPEKAKRVSGKGDLEIEKEAPMSDDMALPIVAFRVYSIMSELLELLYCKEKALDYARECVIDWMKKRGLTEKDLS